MSGLIACGPRGIIATAVSPKRQQAGASPTVSRECVVDVDGLGDQAYSSKGLDTSEIRAGLTFRHHPRNRF
jgi:hypothetical protein